MKDFERYSRNLHACLGWLEMHYCRSGFFHLGKGVLNQYLTILKHRGKPGAIKFCKDSRHLLYCWLAAGGCDSANSDPSTLGILPKFLRPVGKAALQNKDSPNIIRLVLSALYASRGLTLPVKLDTKSIVDAPSFDKGVLQQMDTYVLDFWKELGMTRAERFSWSPRKVRFRRFHMSTKTGPTGRQSMWSALTDIRLLPDKLVESIGCVAGEDLRDKMSFLRSLTSSNPLFSFFDAKTTPKDKVFSSNMPFRKVTGIQSQEGKTRAVAILDYWSQTALRGLHQYLFKWLRKIPQDCTFDQGSFVHKLPDNGEPFYSVDLTAATDRFPIELIGCVLLGQFTPSFVAAWRDIMVGYPFRLQDGSSISYATGNPMGAYSSWNSFALTHHFVMFYCCRSIGINWSEAPYVMLGDDICIRHRRLAEAYIAALRSLGVEVSEKKTHISKSFREFAKRILLNDKELTPFPIGALWSTRKHPDLTLGLCFNELAKGWELLERTPDVLADLYSRLGMPSKARKARTKVLNIAYDLLVGLQGRIDATEALKPMLGRYYPELSEQTIDYSRVLKSVVLSSFAKSASPGKGAQPLGDVAIQLVCMLTDPSFEEFVLSPGEARHPWTSIDLIYAIPVLQVHGLVEEEWLEIRKEVFDSLSQGDWKLTLRALTIPLSDQVYIGSNEDIKPKASFSMAKILTRHLDAFKSSETIDSFLDQDLILELRRTFGISIVST